MYVKGAMQQDTVIDVQVNSVPFNRDHLAEITKLKDRYSSDASGALLSHLLLKKTKSGLHPELIHRYNHGAKFYQDVAETNTDPPVPTCHSVEYDQETKQATILMDDLTETHFQKLGPIPLSKRQYDQAAFMAQEQRFRRKRCYI